MRAILLSLFLTMPAFADPISGADDPAFRAPFDRALQGDDPTALLDLHAAAEAGNTAALLSLPAVQYWLRSTLPFADRKRLSRINGTPLAEAVAAADPVAALWNMGDIGSDTDELLNRAFALYDAGEPDKASFLFMNWLNQTGGYQTLPADFFDHPVPPWAMAQVLWARLNDTAFEPPAVADALVVQRVKAKDPAAWIALAGFAGLHRTEAPPPDLARMAEIFTAAGVAQDDAIRQMQDALPVLRVLRYEFGLPAATAEAAIATLRTEPEFEPILSVCAATCPATADKCVTAFVASFGHPYARVTYMQPLNSLISSRDFFSTQRGRTLLLQSTAGPIGPDPAASSLLAGTRAIDACLADAILAALP